MQSAADRESPRRTSPSTMGWLAIIVMAFMAGVGIIGALASVGIFQSLLRDLKDPHELTSYVLPEESVIYDRTGKIELARFGDSKRDLVTYDQIPPVLLDATTAVEDKTFWENAGFDPVAIISATLDSLRGNSRGASTITQQLVRARLLDDKLVQDPSRTAERKLKEIIQSIRLTEAFPGVTGKQQIITAYLNQNYYGNQAYGVAAAAQEYFGVSLDKLTPAQAAIIAGLPKSPSNYDLVRNAIEQCTTVVAADETCPKSTLVVPDDTTIVQRRNDILDLLAEGDRTPMSGDAYSAADFEAAKHDVVTLASQATPRWIAPHFVWAVRDELTAKLCGPDAETCPALEQGGLRVTTTLDVPMQRIAEKWVKAAAIVPHAKDPKAAAKRLGFKDVQPWMTNLSNKNVRNSALVAVDYQTGELVAYVGSADYYSTSTSKRFQPQYDVVGKGYRQPGSAFKPFNYVVGIDDGTLTAGSMFMDSATDFGGGYTPSDADNLERGPVRLRTALQFSLNIPSVKAMQINSPARVFAKAKDFGMTFQADTTNAGLALALGVQEVRPVDLVTAYGTLGNAGKRVDHTTILTVTDRDGTDVDPTLRATGGHARGEPAGRLRHHRHPRRQHQPQRQPVLGQVRDRFAGRPTPGDPQDRDQQRRQGPQRLRLHRGPVQGGPRRRRLRAGGRRLGRQQRQHAGRERLLDQRRHVRLAGVPRGGHQDLADREVHPPGWPDPCLDRPVDRAARRQGRQVRRRVVHRQQRADEAAHCQHVRRRRPHGARRRLREPLRQLDESRPRLAPPGREGPRHGRRTRADQDRVLLQPHLPSVRALVGRVRRRRQLRAEPEPVAVVHPAADPGRQRRRPVLRAADTGSERLWCGRPGVLPTGLAIPDPIGERAALGGAHADTDAHAHPDTDADPHAHADTHPDTDPAAARSVAGRRPSASIAAMDDVIAIDGLVVRRAGRTILGPLDWHVRPGERWVVIGANGSGKTTLLSVAGLTLWPTAGTVEVLGARYGKVDSREVRRRIGSAGSAVEAVLRDDLTPVDLVMTARNAATEPWWHEYHDADRERARSLLADLGMAAAADQPHGTLSAGERRRVSIARALMPDPDLLLLDEPAASLDLGARETLLADLARLAAAARPVGDRPRLAPPRGDPDGVHPRRSCSGRAASWRPGCWRPF